MMVRILGLLALTLWFAGCKSQHNPQPAAGNPGGSAPATAASASQPAPGINPEPVQPPSQPIEATVPSVASAPPQSSEARPVQEPAQPSYVAVKEAPAAVIPPRTLIRVRMGQTLDARHSRAGERFVAYLDDPVVSGGRIIIPKGTAFQGRVIEAKRSGRLRGRAYLGVELDSFRLYGKVYAIRTAVDFRSSASHKKRNLAIIGGGAGTGAAVGAIAGGGVGALVGAGAGAAAGTTGAFITGKKDVRLPVETPLVFTLRGAVTVRG